MAESVASFLIGKIELVLEEEKNLLIGVQGEVEYIKSELKHMRAFLRVAESMEESDPQVGVWIKQVREIAFDIKDAIDEFTFRLPNGRRDVEPVGFARKIIQVIKNVKYSHQLGHEIQSIKPSIENVSKGHERYKLNVSEQGSSSLTAATTTTKIWDDHRGNALLQEEADLVGIKESKRQLIKFLIEGGTALKVISVVGMGGLGKTTLAKKVYDNVKNNFKNHAWITVSQSFNINEGIIHIGFKQSQQPTPEGMEKMSSAELKNEIKKFLQESKYLLVFDDIWSTGDWESLDFAFPPNNRGSRVMLTTRSEQVAQASCINLEGEVYPLMPLSKVESWTLFCKRIFRGQQCPPELETVSQEILERHQGLPLAIVAISSLFGTRDKNMIEWDSVKHSLASELYAGRLQTVIKCYHLVTMICHSI